MLQLRPECVEPLQNFIKNKKSDEDEIVTCIFGDHIQVEQLDETKLLPLELMHIVHNYYDDKMIVNCSRNNIILLFNISDNDNRIVYHYYSVQNMLAVHELNFDQKDDSIMIIYSSSNHFNLSRLYYAQNNDLSFRTKGSDHTALINNNKYTITIGFLGLTYESKVLNHEILQRRIIVMKQLIDIIKKLHE